MNTNKEIIIDVINKILGLLISLRTVECSPFHSRHWVNSYIDKLSTQRNLLFDDQMNCPSCFGIGGTFDAYSECISDAVCCSNCNGNGFELTELRKTLECLNEESDKKSCAIHAETESILQNAVFRNQ